MIREYQNSDIDAVLDVWAQASQLAHPFLTAEFFAKERASIRDVYMPNARSWVYEIDGQIVGFVSLVGNEVGALFVRPDRHRAGVGGALLSAARERHQMLEVEVFKANSIGRSFYAKYGFTALKEYVHDDTGQPMLRLRCVTT